MPQKKTFDWMRQQVNGFMRTQIIAAAASLSLAEHLQNGPRTVGEIASATGLDREMAFRFLRALAAIGLVASEDERTFHSLPPLETLLSTVPGSLRNLAMVFATPGRYLPWGYFLQGIKTGEPQATTALGSDLFEYYAHHPEEIAIFHSAMQAATAGMTAEIVEHLDISKSLIAVDVGGATASLLYSLMQVIPICAASFTTGRRMSRGQKPRRVLWGFPVAARPYRAISSIPSQRGLVSPSIHTPRLERRRLHTNPEKLPAGDDAARQIGPCGILSRPHRSGDQR
jgi:hypothetical protein